MTSDVSNLKLIIQDSEPQSNGITRAYSKAAAFDDPYTLVTTAIDIKAKFEAKNGAVNAGLPKFSSSTSTSTPPPVRSLEMSPRTGNVCERVVSYVK
ncbi:MAG: hypothetical protein J5737_04840 [Bacteroidales bacterium]|nr:hypothetical protein [Bacteroidales bacterium]